MKKGLQKKILEGAVLLLSVVFFLSGCRGYYSESPPLDLVPNMDDQPKQKAQTLHLKPPVGTVARDTLRAGEDARLVHGVELAGNYLSVATQELFADASVNQLPLPSGVRYTRRIPLAVGESFVLRGMERFNIYCAVCHAQTGTGDSIIMRRGVGLPRPPDLSSETIVAMSDGELYNIITHGRRNMQGYALQVPIDDRWAIVSYLRALQLSRNGTLADVPQEMRQGMVVELRTRHDARLAEEASGEETQAVEEEQSEASEETDSGQ